MRKITCKKRSVNQPSRLFLFLCTAPSLILTVYFILVPTLKAFVLSFTDSTMLGINVHFVGLDNYAYKFHDKNYLQAMGNTVANAFLHGFISQSRDRKDRKRVRFFYQIGQEALAKEVVLAL